MKRFARLVPALLAALTLALAAAAQSPPLPLPGLTPAPQKPKAPPAIATVGPRSVSKEELDARVKAGLEQYQARARSEVPKEMVPLVRRQILEGLVRRELLVLEAERRGMLGTREEAMTELKKDRFFNPNGTFDPTRWDAVQRGQPAEFDAMIHQIQMQLGARKLDEKLQRDFAPTVDEARDAADRALRRAEVDYLGLPQTDFSTDYADPRESEVLDAYQRNADAYRRPERAIVNLVVVANPGISDSLADLPEVHRTWSELMKRKADSLTAVMKRGTPLDSVALDFNGLHRNVIVTRNNFPGFWRGEARDVDALFQTRPGEMMPWPVRGRRGWLLVRMQEKKPSYVAPLVEVARDLRAGLRREASLHHEEREMRALYGTLRDSLKGPAVRVRFAAVDTTRLAVPEPTTADLDRYLKSHLADYSYFDNASGTVRVRSLAEVGPDVRQRWQREQREEIARVTLDQIERAWRKNSRDGSAERAATMLREAGPLPPGAIVDSSIAGFAVSDSLVRRDGAVGVGRGRFANGLLVFQVHGRVENWTPTFEQAVPALRARIAARRAADEERGARALFDADPRSFALGPLVVYTRVVVPVPNVMDIPLTKEEVERYHREHLDRYSVPEEIRARHILVSPAARGDAADAAARARAESLLVRVRRGEDFATLAAQYSDDEATRASGGDLGYFGRGAMLDAFENAVFAMQPGDVSGLVKSEVGYHIIKVIDRLPAMGHPLATMWTTVGADAALEKADVVASRRADSLLRANPSIAKLREAARRSGFAVQTVRFDRDERQGSAETQVYLEKMGTLRAGQMYPGSFKVRGLGWTLSWLDSIGPPRPPLWETAHDRAVDRYRRGGGRRALEAKRAELDSLLGRGVTLDSVGVLWGGLMVYLHSKGGNGLPVLNGGPVLDSLLLGGQKPPVLSPGQISDWLDLPGGYAKFRFKAMTPADPGQIASRAENDRRAELDRKLLAFFDDLKRRWPVSILDPALAKVTLPPLPAQR